MVQIEFNIQDHSESESIEKNFLTLFDSNHLEMNPT